MIGVLGLGSTRSFSLRFFMLSHFWGFSVQLLEAVRRIVWACVLQLCVDSKVQASKAWENGAYKGLYSMSRSRKTNLALCLTPQVFVFYVIHACNFVCVCVRGNSKYHYYGIRVKPDSPLNQLQDDTQYMAMRQQPIHQKQRCVCVLNAQALIESNSQVKKTHRWPPESLPFL